MPLDEFDANEMPDNDAAALAAASNFWSEGKRESLAEAEVPGEGAPSGRQLEMLNQEAADQASELEQSGESDPEEADGIPNKDSTTPEKTTMGKSPAQVVKKQAVEKPSESTEAGLDPVLRAIANDSGWTDEQIDKLYSLDADAANMTFGQLADTYANLSRQFLEVNPGPSQPAFTQNQPAQNPQAPAKGNQLPTMLTDAALAKFAEANGEESANLIKAIRDHFAGEVNALRGEYEIIQQKGKEAELQAVAQEANTSISALRAKFPALYGAGDDPRTMTVAQQNAVIELAGLADQIRAGARAQGRVLSVNDAIKRAHYIVSRDSVKTEARQEVVTNVRRRAAQVTARPTQRNNPRGAGQGKSDDAAIAAAAEKMAEIGMND